MHRDRPMGLGGARGALALRRARTIGSPASTPCIAAATSASLPMSWTGALGADER
jgi:hypothetical protein